MLKQKTNKSILCNSFSHFLFRCLFYKKNTTIQRCRTLFNCIQKKICAFIAFLGEYRLLLNGAYGTPKPNVHIGLSRRGFHSSRGAIAAAITFVAQKRAASYYSFGYKWFLRIVTLGWRGGQFV